MEKHILLCTSKSEEKICETTFLITLNVFLYRCYLSQKSGKTEWSVSNIVSEPFISTAHSVVTVSLICYCIFKAK